MSAWELGGTEIGDWTAPGIGSEPTAAVRHRLFVDGGDGPPSVATRVVPVEDWFGDGRGFYQVIVKIDGVRVADRLSSGGGRERDPGVRRAG